MRKQSIGQHVRRDSEVEERRTAYCSNEPSYSSGLSFVGLDEKASSNEAKAAGCCWVVVDGPAAEGPAAVGEASGEASRSVPQVAGDFLGPEGLRVRVEDDFMIRACEKGRLLRGKKGCCWVLREGIRRGEAEAIEYSERMVVVERKEADQPAGQPLLAARCWQDDALVSRPPMATGEVEGVREVEADACSVMAGTQRLGSTRSRKPGGWRRG
jgi:hypothetical protein